MVISILSTFLANGKGLNCDSGGSIYGVIALDWEWIACAFPVLLIFIQLCVSCAVLAQRRERTDQLRGCVVITFVLLIGFF